MKKLILFALLFCVTISWAQKEKWSLHDETSRFLCELEKIGVSTYFSVDRACDAKTKESKFNDGSTCTQNKRCVSRYIFWKTKRGTMVKQLDECGGFAPVLLKDDAFFNFHKNHRKEIRAHKVKPYVYSGGNKRVYKAGMYKTRRFYMFKDKTGAFTQKYNLFYLTNEERELNKNYNYNSKLHIVTLDKMIDDAIVFMQNNRQWRRI